MNTAINHHTFFLSHKVNFVESVYEIVPNVMVKYIHLMQHKESLQIHTEQYYIRTFSYKIE